MAADSDGCGVGVDDSLTTVVTCEGDLSDPGFQAQLKTVLHRLDGLLGGERSLKVRKLEPWNSVRVTLSVPREAALRLRQLANEGSQQLRALGILSVQVEGDQVISLRLVGAGGAEPHEIVLRTAQDASAGTSTGGETGLSRLLSASSGGGGGGSSSSNHQQPPSAVATVSNTADAPLEKVQFRSPNVVCPPDTIVPKVPVSLVTNSSAATPATTKTFAGPFPFASMNQAIISRDSLSASNSYTTAAAAAAATAPHPPPPPPPPYPGNKHPPVTLSSPLLVNLLQNEGAAQAKDTVVNGALVGYAQRQPPPPPSGFVQKLAPKVNAPPPPKPPPKQSYAKQQPPPAVVIPQTNSLLTNSTTTTINTTSTAAAAAPPNNSVLANSKATKSGGGAVRPCPPPYPAAAVAPPDWEASNHHQFLELTPTLTDLKADDLDHILPSLERDLAGTPPDLPDDELPAPSSAPAQHKERNFLINPLTGELEPQPSSDSDSEEQPVNNVFLGLTSPAGISDEDTNSTIRPDTATDQSDSETRSSHSDSGKHARLKSSTKTRPPDNNRGRDSPGIKPTEKIKLRLKLEKSEPVNPAYKVDVSFINTPQPKKASTSPAAEEPRVPPLHISLRGRNHVVINSKKKTKFNADGSPVKPKARKTSKSDEIHHNSDQHLEADAKKLKKQQKPSYDPASLLLLNPEAEVGKAKLAVYNNVHYKEKLKERRGSDSELARATKKYSEANGILHVDKKRRLSQTEQVEVEAAQQPSVLGSTNMGTIMGLPAHKPRKEKVKSKETFKSKELNRNKGFSKNLVKQVTLPTGEIDMEAKFKQRLLEEPEKGVPRPPHRTETSSSSSNTTLQQQQQQQQQQQTENTNRLEQSEKVQPITTTDPPPLKDKPPEPDKCNTPDRTKTEISDKQAGRSPNSGAQGEDSGIESMDALSEKSPNQASQSPHADIADSTTTTTTLNKPKTQVPDMLDIEAQLAKMEGLNGEDLNENKQHNGQTKLEQCCGSLTSVLQDSLKQGTVTLTTTHSTPSPLKEQVPQVEVSLVPIKNKQQQAQQQQQQGKETEDLEPLPVRVTPPLYTYSNPEKSRGSDSPSLSDSDNSNSCSTIKSTSLLEQLLIEIPDHQTPSSPSPAAAAAARSLRTRATSKMNSPELINSPVIHPQQQQQQQQQKQTRTAAAVPAKRKRHESDSSNHSLEDVRGKKTRKCSENAAELIKACMGVEPTKSAGGATGGNTKKNNNKVVVEESSDSDEPLIEKVRKGSVNSGGGGQKGGSGNKGGGKGGAATGLVGSKVAAAGAVNTRRSVRTMPALNTRSKGDKVQLESDVLRRKTRSTVSEVESKQRGSGRKDNVK